jgi:serine phosphatase RsbU (regulator of sigma subunit)
MKFRRIIYVGGALLLLLIVFTIDVVRKNVALEVGGLSLIRDVMIIGIFALVYLFQESAAVKREQSPVKKLGLIMVSVLIMIVVGAGFLALGDDGFDSKNFSLLPLGYGTIFLATWISVLFGALAMLIMRSLRDLVFYKRKRGTQRNFLVLMGLTFATAISTVMLQPLETSILTSILFGLSIAVAIANSFRLSWIVYLTKREKISGLIYGFFLFVGFIGLNIILHNSLVTKSLLYYSYPLRQFTSIVCIFGNIYSGMAFVSTLFHLPTAEAFERKTSELSSLHNLSRLVTQVFDFNELVDTVTSMTLQVCEANSCWLEIIHYPDEERGEALKGDDFVAYSSSIGNYHVQLAAKKNITEQQITMLFSTDERTIRDVVLESRAPIIVDAVARDSRFKQFKKTKLPFGSLVVMPLVSHTGLIGILYATKESEYGFFKDDVDVISAFADQATVAIQNSRLIKKSLERERLLREMMLAQEMQRRLLPQRLPAYATLEIDAVSTPAFEVGGDYYDFVQLDEHTLGIVVGDVSGKGVSAAFYMAEVKGIFQSLSRMYPSPKQFMIKANEALASSIDKRSFVSLIYGLFDVRTGGLKLARAGHCPMLLVSGERVEYIRPNGMGMGLGRGGVFSHAIEEQGIQLRAGDVCIFFTDGVTEAQRSDEEEFGYDRLMKAAERAKGKHASAIKDEILESVKKFIDTQANHDDLTLVVLKWKGSGHQTIDLTSVTGGIAHE